MKDYGPRRIILETSLKPFSRTDEGSIRARCGDLRRCWQPLLDDARRISILLWVGDGTEILLWNDDMEAPIPWAQSIGFCNLDHGAYFKNPHYSSNPATDYKDDPPTFTYAALQRIVQCLKEEFRGRGGSEPTVGATFDPGPEFVQNSFRFERHPELLTAGPGADPVFPMKFVFSDARFHADPAPRAGFPEGIPEGSTLGKVLGRQFSRFASAMGIDYLWMSNGFGFSHYAWSHRGELFDGTAFRPEKSARMRERLLSFWRDFRRECPSLGVEARGSNFSVGMDVSKDGVPFEEIRREASLPYPPPNPPWGSNNLGLEMAAFLSRMAGSEDGRTLFRFYISDPWFVSNPWWAYYGREPYDVYCPMSASRLSRSGSVDAPTDLAFLSVDDELGRFDSDAAGEVIPHVRRAFRYAADAPGILTWIYPYGRYNALPAREPERIGQPFFHDWFVSRAVTMGLPLNTVMADTDFLAAAAALGPLMRDTVLLTPVPVRGDGVGERLLEHVRSGGRAILYGSAEDAGEEVRTALGLRLEAPLSGDLALELPLAADVFRREQPPRTLRHDPLTSGGGIREVPSDPGDPNTRILARVASAGAQRAYALVRADPSWNGGAVGWIRGSSPLLPSDTLEPAFLDPGLFADPSEGLRLLLAALGTAIVQDREDPYSRPVNTFISRHRGGFFFSGYAPDLTVDVSYLLPFGAPIFQGTDAVVSARGARYRPARSFHHECRVFVSQQLTSLVTYRENSPRIGKDRRFIVTGLQDATVTVFPYPESVREGGVSVREAEQDAYQDPSTPAAPRNRKIDGDHLGREIPVRVEGASGRIVVEGITGSISVMW